MIIGPSTIQHLSAQQLVSDIWNYNGTTWDPLGLPMPSSRITMSSFDGYLLNLFEIISISTDSGGQQYTEALLATDVGLVVKKDIAAGGVITANQGELWLGHGQASYNDVPQIILMHSDPSYGDDPNIQAAKPDYNTDLKLFTFDNSRELLET